MLLDHLLPAARKVEVDTIELAAPPAVVWDHVRHGDLADSPFARALFALRTLPSRLTGAPPEPTGVRIDDLRSTPELPGFQLLGDDPPRNVEDGVPSATDSAPQGGAPPPLRGLRPPSGFPRELTVGAIGKVWKLDIPFVHVDGPEAYAAFAEPGWIKVAWAIRVEPLGDASSRVTVEVRVDATDDASWERFSLYWHVIGPGSHFVRHAAFAGLRRRFGALSEREEERALPGDDLLPDAGGQLTYAITIHAKPEAIWPWLVQMGCRRGGFYAIDLLDNGGEPSAVEIRPELQKLTVGDVIPATPEGDDGFEVLAIDPCRTLLFGGLFDVAAGKQIPFASLRPERYWQITWSFVLERLDDERTTLHVRARAAFSPSERLHVAWIRPVHTLMQTAQLRHLAARAEGRFANKKKDGDA